jgi:dihydropyrimidine dehydrogenase (NAD+) subunit PreA
LIGQVPGISRSIVRGVKKAVGTPVVAKMTPEVGYPHLLSVAKAIVDAGADGITCINAPISVCPPDIYRRGRPRYAGTENFAFGGTYGPWDRFLAYKFIAAICRHFDIDVSGVGGAVDPEHVVEFLMLGAKTVQLSSGIIWRGHRLIGRTLRFLQDFTDEQGYESVEQLSGLSQDFLVDLDDVRFEPSRSFLDPSRCTGCGICVEGICAAIDWHPEYERLPEVNEELCVGCGMCSVICPQGAFEIQQTG